MSTEEEIRSAIAEVAEMWPGTNAWSIDELTDIALRVQEGGEVRLDERDAYANFMERAAFVGVTLERWLDVVTEMAPHFPAPDLRYYASTITKLAQHDPVEPYETTDLLRFLRTFDDHYDLAAVVESFIYETSSK